jgi:hypothetical protein
MIYKHRGHLWIGKAAKIRCFLSRVSRQQSTCNGFMFVIKNHANKNRLIKNLVIYVPTKLSSLAFSSSPFRSVQSRSVPFRSVLDNDLVVSFSVLETFLNRSSTVQNCSITVENSELINLCLLGLLQNGIIDL